MERIKIKIKNLLLFFKKNVLFIMLIKRIGNIYIDNIDALAKTLLEKFEEISSLVNNTGNFKR